MQGKLSNRTLSATLTTECAQSGQTLRFRVESDLAVELLTEGAQPVISVPLNNFKKLGVKVIYDAL